MHDTKNNTNGNCIVRPVLLDAPAGKHHGERKGMKGVRACFEVIHRGGGEGDRVSIEGDNDECGFAEIIVFLELNLRSFWIK